jgi:hypothetical protein
MPLKHNLLAIGVRNLLGTKKRKKEMILHYPRLLQLASIKNDLNEHGQIEKPKTTLGGTSTSVIETRKQTSQPTFLSTI